MISASSGRRTQDGQGRYVNSAGDVEHNPVEVGRPPQLMFTSPRAGATGRCSATAFAR